MVPSTIGPYATRHDFANLLAPKIERLRGMADQAKRRASTPLQDYVVARLDGRETGVSFLDRMDLHAAIRTCEMLGTAACFGRKAHFEDLDRERQRTARTLGFEIARRGKDGIDELLREMWMSFLRRRNASEGGFGRQAFGALHYFLRMDPKQPRPKDQAFVALRTGGRRLHEGKLPARTGRYCFRGADPREEGSFRADPVKNSAVESTSARSALRTNYASAYNCAKPSLSRSIGFSGISLKPKSTASFLT